MKGRGISIGVLLIVLFTFVAPGAFAKKQKLGDAEAKRIFEGIARAENATELNAALKVFENRMKEAKKIPDLNKLLDYGGKGYDIITNAMELYGLYKSWTISNKDPKNVVKAGNLVFDTLDFVSGKFAGANYYQAVIKMGREALKMINRKNAELRWTQIIADPTTELTLRPNSTIPSRKGNGVAMGWAFDDNYLDFTKAWFCAVWQTGMKTSDEIGLLYEINEYIWALEEFKKTGLMQ
jgi:hypothetical protein